jgi:hypothetical protein
MGRAWQGKRSCLAGGCPGVGITGWTLARGRRQLAQAAPLSSHRGDVALDAHRARTVDNGFVLCRSDRAMSCSAVQVHRLRSLDARHAVLPWNLSDTAFWGMTCHSCRVARLNWAHCSILLPLVHKR